MLLICGRVYYDSCCIMALSQKLIRGCMSALKLPNTLYASADCTESGNAYPFCYWQTLPADGNKLSMEQQKAFISCAAMCKAGPMQVCGMSCRAEHA